MINSIFLKLKHRRIELGMTLEEVALKTKINYKVIRAMENRDISFFDSEAYMLGFIKIYADYLKVDISEYIEYFKENKSYNKTQLFTPDNIFEDSRPSKLTIVSSILIAIIIYSTWYNFFYSESPDIILRNIRIDNYKLSNEIETEEIQDYTNSHN